jgi:carboxymethylenebutenolidase
VGAKPQIKILEPSCAPTRYREVVLTALMKFANKTRSWLCSLRGMVNQLAVRLGQDLNAGVAYYGRQPAIADVPKISAPLTFNYAGNDQGVNSGIQAYEAALTENKKVFKSYMYDGKQHGFHNDTTPRYDEEAAKLAWSRTLEWFNKYLR